MRFGDIVTRPANHPIRARELGTKPKVRCQTNVALITPNREPMRPSIGLGNSLHYPERRVRRSIVGHDNMEWRTPLRERRSHRFLDELLLIEG
jgi:hypothetical protein